MGSRQVISIELATATFRVLVRSPRAKVLSPHRPWARSFERPRPGHLLLFVCSGRPLSTRDPVPRRQSNIDCWLLAQIFTTTVWRRLWKRQFSNFYAPAQPQPTQTKRTSSPPGNWSHPMANPGQVPNLEGLHREIHDMAEQMRIMNENNGRLMQLLTAANPQLPAAPSVPDAERSRHSNSSEDRSHNVSTERARGRRRAPSPSLRERSSSSESSQTQARVRRGRSPNRGDHTGARDKSTSQTDPPFPERVLRARISSKFKLPTQLGIYEGKTDPMDHLDSYKSLMSLQGCSDEVMCKAFSATLKGPTRNRQKNASHLFTIHQKESESLKNFVKRFNQAVLEVEDPNDKVIIMAMMEGLRPGPLFDSLSKNVPETLSALQSKADKYITTEELAEAKRRQRGKDDHKRKEPDTRRADYREETRYKRPDRDPKRSNDRRPRTPPHRPEFTLPPLNTPVAQAYTYPTTMPWSSRPSFANFNVQRILIDNGSSADILFISAFERMKNWAGQAAPFSYPPDRIWRKCDAPLGMDQLTNNPRRRTTPDHRMAGFYCGRLPLALQCHPRATNFRRNQGDHLDLSPEAKVSHPTGIGEIKGDQKSGQAMLHLGHES
ncbi:hypothetical protein Acr_00g0042720 [Actinidia rufa]|uniref:Retrotransposon gag domain-containing protein n=1 Tax=Actinidia rufa TaxID=165716 RepID=A0A7J0DJP4_9ERIC|nr:hypothetical protein Acr_00g0042720 [Actinidia rufa]